MFSFQAHFRHHCQGFFAALLAIELGIDLQWLFQNLPHLLTWIQRTVGVLEDNLNLLASQFFRTFIGLEQILPLIV